MSPYPAYQRGVGYGDRFDAKIVRCLKAGLGFEATAARIGISAWFVGCRARALGYETGRKPPLQRRADADLSRPVERADNPTRMLSEVLRGRRDDGPSRLVRAMRQRLFVLDRDGLDPSHGVACLHLAGLTLPEIEGVTGYPASAVVAAVRAHCAPLGASGAGR